MYCRECGKEYNVNAIACTSCGTNPRLGNSFCSACGVKTKANQILCIKCGVALNAAHFGGTNQTHMSRPYIDNHMVKAVLCTLLCCLPFGIIAIIKSSEVNGKLAAGDVVGAQASASSSSDWSNIGIILGLFVSLMLLANGI